MQVTIDLEKELWDAAQKRARSEQTTVEQLLNQLVHSGLAADSASPRRDAFTFSLPGGPVTAEDVREALEEE